MKSQNKQILNHLKKGWGLTALPALKTYNVMRLASRIYDLRAKGHDIKDAWIRVGDKKVKRYYMEV